MGLRIRSRAVPEDGRTPDRRSRDPDVAELRAERLRAQGFPIGLLARIVHGADVAEDVDATPQSPGLRAVAEGFSYFEPDDHRQLELELPVYDALYAWCRHELEAGAS